MVNSNKIQSKSMNIEEKINYLEKLNSQGININTLPKDYISEDNVIVNNVISNIYNAYKKSNMSVKQILRCEQIGIKFEPTVDTNLQIDYLSKALKEGIAFSEYTCGEKASVDCLVNTYIKSIREKYDASDLDSKQIDICVNSLNIIIPREELINILKTKIKKTAYKNIIFCEDIL